MTTNTLNWNAPSQHVDGTSLSQESDLLRYKVMKNSVLLANVDSPAVGTAPATSYPLPDGTFGTFTVIAVDRLGSESVPSNAIVIASSPPKPPELRLN